jgi:hypothetical protein
MKKRYPLFALIATSLLWISSISVRADGPAPPPPGHSLNGNQASPGGTGCPIDRTQGIFLAMALCLGYGGIFLYNKGRKSEETLSEE